MKCRATGTEAEQTITAAIRYLRAHGWQDLMPAQINQGNCDLFADEVCALVAIHGGLQLEAEWMPDEIPHCAVQLNGKWFDAEAPEGAPLAEHPFVVRWRRSEAAIITTL